MRWAAMELVHGVAGDIDIAAQHNMWAPVRHRIGVDFFLRRRRCALEQYRDY